MNAPLWTATAATLNLWNVPTHSRAWARANVAALLNDTEVDFLGTEETWWPRTRRGVYAALRAADAPYRHATAGIKQSCLLAWRSDNWTGIRRERIKLHGVVAGSYGLVSDARHAIAVLLEHNDSGRRVWVIVAHPTPKGSRKGARAVRAATKARNQGYDNLSAWLRRHDGYPALLLADWNDDDPFMELANRSVDLAKARGVGIDKVLTVRSDKVLPTLPSPARIVPVPHTDHPGAVVVDVVAVAR